jgi:hypothetical protein
MDNMALAPTIPIRGDQVLKDDAGRGAMGDLQSAKTKGLDHLALSECLPQDATRMEVTVLELDWMRAGVGHARLPQPIMAQEASGWKVRGTTLRCTDRTDCVAEILEYIQQNFDFMTKDKCVPIQIALKLLDSSSLGLASQHDRFHQTHQDLQRALKAIVNGTVPAKSYPDCVMLM